MSDVFWQAIIAGAVTIILAWMNQRTKRAVEKVADDAASHVETVKETLEKKSQEEANTIQTLAQKVEEVHIATNSIKDELVQEVRKAALLQGAKDERESKRIQ